MDAPCQQWFKPGYFLFAISISPLIFMLHVPWSQVRIFLIMSCQFTNIACWLIQIWIWSVTILFSLCFMTFFDQLMQEVICNFSWNFGFICFISFSFGFSCSSDWWGCKGDFKRKRSLEQFRLWRSWWWVLLFLASLSRYLPERFVVPSRESRFNHYSTNSV